MPLLAAVVWLAIAVGTIAAAHAGGPLYPTRLWLENATVPTNGSARVTAELDRLESRVEEVLEAANNGDVQGVAAALDAYAAIAADATAAGSGDPVQLARVEQALANHVAVLTAVAAGLSDRGNDTAADAVERNIERAIAHNAAVIAGLAAHQGGGPAAGRPSSGVGAGSDEAGGAGNAYGARQGGGNTNNAGQGGGTVSSGTGGQGAAAPSATAEPTVTSEPAASPEPSAAAGGDQGAGGQGPGTGGGQGAGGQGPGTGGGQGGGPSKPSAAPDSSEQAPHSPKG
jgi:hypothetical protein